MDGVRREIVILPLFAVGNDRRACGFEPLDGVSNGNFVERNEVRILAVGDCDSLDEIGGSWDAAYRLGGYDRRWRDPQIGLRWAHATPASRRGPVFAVTLVYRDGLG